MLLSISAPLASYFGYNRTNLAPVSAPIGGKPRKLQRSHLPWLLGSSSFQYASSAGQVTVLFSGILLWTQMKTDSCRKLRIFQLSAQGQLQNNNGWPRSEIGLFVTCYKLTKWIGLENTWYFFKYFSISAWNLINTQGNINFETTYMYLCRNIIFDRILCVLQETCYFVSMVLTSL